MNSGSVTTKLVWLWSPQVVCKAQQPPLGPPIVLARVEGTGAVRLAITAEVAL